MMDITSLKGNPIPDPVCLLVNFGDLDTASARQAIQNMDGGLMFSESNKNKVWVAISQQDLLIFKIKYGDRIIAKLSSQEFKDGKDIVRREAPDTMEVPWYAIDSIMSMLCIDGYAVEEWTRTLRQMKLRGYHVAHVKGL